MESTFFADAYAFVAVNFEKFFFAFITLVIGSAAIMDIRDKNYPPGPLGVPIFGYLPFMGRRAPHLKLTELARHYGRMYSVNLGSVYAVVVSDLQLIKDAFSEQVFNTRPRMFVNHGVTESKGLLSAEGETYRNNRNVAVNGFQDLRSKGNVESRVQATVKEFVQEIKQSAGQSIQMDDVVLHHVGNALSDLILGEKFQKDNESWKYLKVALKTRFNVFALTNYVNFVPWMRYMAKYAAVLTDLRNVKASVQKILKSITDKSASAQETQVKSILDAYVAKMKTQTKGEFSPENVREIMSDILNVSWETTATTLQWLYLYMATHPVMQERAADEIKAIVGKNKEATLKDIEKMPYTKACMLEILRHRTALPFGVPHGTLEKTEIGGFWIPKGSMIIPNLYAVHHDPRVWERPDEFLPERHLDEDGYLRAQENILPFQAGTRSCVGEDIARNMILLFFVNSVSQFRFKVPKGGSLQVNDMAICGLTLSPKPYCLQAETR